MYIKEKSLDGILFKVYTELLSRPIDVVATKGSNSEIFGCLIELTNPRARLSITETKGKAFSPLGELLWYLSKTNKLDFIQYYIKPYIKSSDDNLTIHGGYGPRLFNKDGAIDQVKNIIKILKKKPTSRRAVIQLFDAKDLLEYHKDIPCTTTLQFTIRDSKLIMMTSMRSNDVYLGLPHDIFCFTMLQELIAVTLGVEIGTYYHSVGSLHLYESNLDYARTYISEGVQSSTYEMPQMPSADPWDSIQEIIIAEKKIREDEFRENDNSSLSTYWQDLILLLRIHKVLKSRKYDEIEILKSKICHTIYHNFIDQRVKAMKKAKRIK